MSDTATIDPPDESGAAARTKLKVLKAAIEAVQHEERRLAALTEAQDRAKRETWHAQSKVNDASDKLRQLNRDEPQRVAYRYLNNDGDLAELDDPIADAKARLAKAQAEANQLEKVSSALSDESQYTRTALSDLRHKLYVAKSELVCTSPEYLALVQEHKDTWTNLRSIKAALSVVATGLHGQIDRQYTHEANRSEPLEVRVGYDIDREFVNEWAEAISSLETDSEAHLPQI